jgi:hypothetical protein
MKMNETIQVITGLLALCRSGTFNCDLDGAAKMTQVRARAEAELQRLIAEENENAPEEGDTNE